MPRNTLSSTKRKTNVFSFSVPLDQMTLIDEIDKIAKREDLKRGEIIVKALKEYYEEHRVGNYQHSIDSFTEDAVYSKRQIENQIVEYFVEQHNNHRDIHIRDVYDKIRIDMMYDTKKTQSCLDRLLPKIREHDIKIWR